MLEEQQVRDAIHALMERKDVRIGELQAKNRKELQAQERLLNEVAILELHHGIDTLIELEHTLRLCDCPDEAYAPAQKGL